MRKLPRLSICLGLGAFATVTLAWMSALFLRLDLRKANVHETVRNAELLPSEAWDYGLFRAVTSTREFAMITTDVRDWDITTPSDRRLPTHYMASALADTRFTRPNGDHSGFLCLDTRGCPLPALSSQWEYGLRGVHIAAGLPIRVPVVERNGVFDPQKVVILPTRIRWLYFVADVALWTILWWGISRMIWPNKHLEPTPADVMPVAGAPVTPSSGAAHF
jgi:hypothetical protein